MEVLQLKCGVSVNKIVGGDSGKLIEVEHSTVTIKTDQDAEPKVDSVKTEDDSTSVRSSKRRRSSTNDLQEPVRPIKRKRHSDLENNSVVEKENNVIPNNCQPEKSSKLEILPVPIKKHQVNGVNDKNAEKQTQPKDLQREYQKNCQSDDEEDEGNDVVMVELDEEFVVEKLDGEGASSDSCQSQDESNVAVVIGNQQPKSTPSHRLVLSLQL